MLLMESMSVMIFKGQFFLFFFENVVRPLDVCKSPFCKISEWH